MIKKIKNKILIFILTSRVWSFFITKILWRFRFSNYYAQATGEQFDKAQRVLKRGDILFSKDKHKVVSYLIPGKVSHAAIYVSETEVIEATHEGVHTSTLFDFFKESDLVIASRCNDFDSDYCECLIKNARNFIGRPYDASLMLGTSALYCSELVYESDVEKRINYDLSDLIGLGREYISPEGILEASNMTQVFSTEEKP